MGRRVDWDDVIGTDGVCEILELKRKSDLRVLRQRGGFPEPDKWLSARCPAWDRRRIVAYKRKRPRERKR